ncbi:MAG: glycosyltransferase family 39 protein, partial [Ruthenibacterium sp.]
MPKQRVARALQIATDVLFALCFGAVLARLLLYGAEYISDMPAEVNNWLALCVALVWLCILLLAAHGMQRFANTAIGRFFASARGALFAFALLLSVQLTIALCCYCPSGWDPQVLLTTANEMLLGTPYTGTYFHQNPNNLFLLGCYRYFFALLNRFGLTDYMPWAVGAGVCLVNLSCLFLFLLARRLFGMRAAWLSFLLCAPAVALSPWISVPYSDTYGIPFAIGSVYFYVIAREELRPVRSGLYAVLCGAWLALGTRIKPTVLLLVIAAAGMELLCRAGHRHDAEDASATPKKDRHALLRTVAHGWAHEALTEQAAQVQQIGQELHARLST